jgi:hypothetical protein
MISSLRQAFNSQWTEEQYAEFTRMLRDRAGVAIAFPVSATPCFLPSALMQDLSAAGIDSARRFRHKGDCPHFRRICVLCWHENA